MLSIDRECIVDAAQHEPVPQEALDLVPTDVTPTSDDPAFRELVLHVKHGHLDARIPQCRLDGGYLCEPGRMLGGVGNEHHDRQEERLAILFSVGERAGLLVPREGRKLDDGRRIDRQHASGRGGAIFPTNIRSTYPVRVMSA